jgi:hypothetical protein
MLLLVLLTLPPQTRQAFRCQLRTSAAPPHTLGSCPAYKGQDTCLQSTNLHSAPSLTRWTAFVGCLTFQGTERNSMKLAHMASRVP